MEGPHVFQDWMEAGAADELVSDLDDAGPQLVPQVLPIRRALVLHKMTINNLLTWKVPLGRGVRQLVPVLCISL